MLFGLAVRQGGRGALGWLTVALGLFALLGAVDRGLVLIPYLPVPPSLVRILIELVWLPWVLVVLLRRASDGRPAPPAGPDPAATGTGTGAGQDPAPVGDSPGG